MESGGRQTLDDLCTREVSLHELEAQLKKGLGTINFGRGTG